jgi:hypothetical protein
MRSGSVSRPRCAIQASNGPGMPPADVRQARRRSSSAPSRAASAPSTTSEWPDEALVSEVTLTSAPSASGRCRQAVAVVLSTATGAPAARASATRRAMSKTRRKGLVGVSIHKVDGARASSAATASRSARSTAVARRPNGSSSAHSLRVP